MRIVVALGGNALLRRGDKPDADIQLRHVRAAAEALVDIAEGNELVVCHGNGPQVGLLALESDADPALSRPYPLDALGAQTQGMIGYWLVQELRNAGMARPLVAVITQTVVNAADPAFGTPTKFVGPVYDELTAQRLAAAQHWTVAPDGKAWRRVVPSPEPLRVVERGPIMALLDAGCLVVCGGGGGAPVIEDHDGHLVGVEAVVDKDLTATQIALAVNADRLLLLTDVPAVMRDFGTPDATEIRLLTIDQLAGLHLPTGSMGPKIDACARFTTATGRPSAIGALTEAAAVLAGTAGTTVTVEGLPEPVGDDLVAGAA